MHLTHLVIDDFFNDPVAIRAAALAMDYPPRPERAAYPGRNAAGPLQLDGMERLISQIVHERVVPADYASHAVPRLALEGAERKANVHIDFNHWSGVICLTLDEHCQGGTHFFRHRATGWDRAPVFPGEAESRGYASSREAVKTILDEGGTDRSQWEEVMTIPLKFNRLALFRGYLWHDAGVSFGTTAETGRLILPVFFETVQ